jgi:hypothetical protein
MPPVEPQTELRDLIASYEPRLRALGIADRCGPDTDEAKSADFMALLRDEGVLTDQDWEHVVKWLHAAMRELLAIPDKRAYLASLTDTASRDRSGRTKEGGYLLDEGCYLSPYRDPRDGSATCEDETQGDTRRDRVRPRPGATPTGSKLRQHTETSATVSHLGLPYGCTGSIRAAKPFAAKSGHSPNGATSR